MSNPKILTFTAPKNEKLLKMWDEAIQREDRELSIRDVVCEKHFDPTCIIKEWQRGDSLIPLKHPRLKKDAIPCIFPKRRLENERPRKLPNILKKFKPEQFIVISSESEAEIENSNDTNNDNISTLPFENNAEIKPKLVSLNITKDNYLTILPLQGKNSDFEFKKVLTENITNQGISEAPVKISPEKEPISNIVKQVIPFFDFIWNSPLKLSSDSWSLVKVTSKKKQISIGKYILNSQGIPYPERQVLLNEDLTIKYVINGRILQKHIFLSVIQSLQQLEEAIFNINSLQICTGGPSTDKYPLDLDSYNKKKYIDIFLDVWRHNECTLIIFNEQNSSTDCSKCRTLSDQAPTLETKSDRQKNKDKLIRRLKTKVNMLKKLLEKSHQFKSTGYDSTDDEDVDKMEEVIEPKNKVLEEEKIIVKVEKPATKNTATTNELKEKKLRDKIDKWKELEWRDELELEDIDELDFDDDEMDLEGSPQIISTMEDAHDNIGIEGINDDEDKSISKSELCAGKESLLNLRRLLVVEYL